MSSKNKDKFAEIFSNDPLGLLSVEEERQTTHTDEEKRLIESFQEIVEFFENNGHLPSETGDLGEFRLAKRLTAIKQDPSKVRVLQPYDLYDLLDGKETKTITIDDILAEDPLGILDDDTEQNIYRLSHVQPSDRIRPDFIARRTVCKDFDKYKEGFDEIKADLQSGKRKLSGYSRDELVGGKYYILRGVIFYLEIPELKIDQRTYISGVYNRLDGRTRCIFDNGTESNMLFRSLDKAMNIDGFCITEPCERIDKQSEITESDVQNGYIYVLRSLNPSMQIKSIKNLYKIGYSSGSVTDRIKNAVNEPTYLMSQVMVVLTVRCYNMDTHYLETAIHAFFGAVNVAFEITDKSGNVHYPREWFTAPLDVIAEAIKLIVAKEADQYRYDPAVEQIVKK